MTNCEECLRASRDPQGYAVFNPACFTCGARCLWFIQRMRIGQEDKRARLRSTLATWVQYGHPEPALRETAKQDWGRWSHEHRHRN